MQVSSGGVTVPCWPEGSPRLIPALAPHTDAMAISRTITGATAVTALAFVFLMTGMPA